MNELAKQQPTGLVTTANPMGAGFNFFDPVQFDTMQRVCKMFSSSELVPEIYKAVIAPIPQGANEATIAAIQAQNQAAQSKACANCMIAIEVAMRIGASPLMVMQNMVPIYGKPTWSSKFLIATVNSCGRFEPLKYRFTEKGALGMVDYTDYVWNNASRRKEAVQKQFDGKKIIDIECVAYTTAKGSKEILESSPVSIRLAIQEGWYTKNGSKWQTMPRQMLMYRAASWWTSAYAPELSMGMRTVEEQQDIVDVTFEDVTDKPATERASNANRTNIVVDMEAPAPKPETKTPRETPPAPQPNANQATMPDGTKVDTATGEVVEEAPAGPGF